MGSSTATDPSSPRSRPPLPPTWPAVKCYNPVSNLCVIRCSRDEYRQVGQAARPGCAHVLPPVAGTMLSGHAAGAGACCRQQEAVVASLPPPHLTHSSPAHTSPACPPITAALPNPTAPGVVLTVPHHLHQAPSGGAAPAAPHRHRSLLPARRRGVPRRRHRGAAPHAAAGQGSGGSGCSAGGHGGVSYGA